MRRQGPTNDGLPKKEYNFSGGDNHKWRGHSRSLLAFKKLNFMHSQAVATQKLWVLVLTPKCQPWCQWPLLAWTASASASFHYEPLSETFSYLDYYFQLLAESAWLVVGSSHTMHVHVYTCKYIDKSD